MDPISERKQVVQTYREAGLGGERYGVVCPKCLKRICLQGIWFAREPEYTGKYCLCEENYTEESAITIGDVMYEHGLPPEYGYTLNPQPNMTEGGRKPKRNNTKKKIPTIGDELGKLLKGLN